MCLLDLEKYKMKSIICLTFCVVLFSSLFAQVTTDIVNKNAESQSFVGAQGYAISSIGHFEENWKEGSGFYVTYGSISSNHWSLIFQTGYISFKQNENVNYVGDPKFTIIPLMIGTRYYLGTQEVATEDEKVDKTSAHYNFQVGLGLGIILFSNLEIEGQAKYNSHLLEPSVPYNITGMEYGVALNWYLR
jgi:uncharacterized protein YuzB (UPF0349 family)